MQSCFFTGHRNSPSDTKFISNTKNIIENLIIKNGITDFYAGGAVGWDTICAGLVLSLKENYPQIRLHLVLPCPPEIQAFKWTFEQQKEYYRILKAADDVEIISPKYDADCMKKRNARLVERGNLCVCYYNEKNFRSGTGQTVRMAQRAGKKIINMYNYSEE